MKKNTIFLLVLLVVAVISISNSARADNKPLIKSTVVDVDGRPVQGAYIFFYDSPDTRRAVDLVSPVTDKNGFCQKEIPPGDYWAVARLKKEGDFDMGPLMVEDKLSADPAILSVVDGEVIELKLTVLDLLDTIRTKTKKRQDLAEIDGVILNQAGDPQKNVFVFANRHNKAVVMPQYFSAWTGEDGKYSIYLPVGKYYLGVAREFASSQRYTASTPVVVVEGQKPLTIGLQLD